MSDFVKQVDDLREKDDITVEAAVKKLTGKASAVGKYYRERKKMAAAPKRKAPPQYAAIEIAKPAPTARQVKVVIGTPDDVAAILRGL